MGHSMCTREVTSGGCNSWVQVLSPMQHARMMIIAYPSTVDMMALCSWLVTHTHPPGQL